MKRIILILALSFVFQLDSDRAKAQQPEKVYRIGYMANASGIRADTEEVFRKALRELGYIEGRNLTLEWRFSKGRLDQLPELAAELVRLKVDCIVAFGIAPTRAAKDATTTIPIVMGNADDDPIRHGLVASLARPGGNVTGLIDMLPDLAGKRLELLKETFPKLSRVAHLSPGTLTVGPNHRKEMKPLAAPWGYGFKLWRCRVLTNWRAPSMLQSRRARMLLSW